MRTKSKTPNGIAILAMQRENQNKAVRVKTATVSAATGRLIVTGSIGDDRGITVVAQISLEEILAWLPDLTQQAKETAARVAVKNAAAIQQETPR